MHPATMAEVACLPWECWSSRGDWILRVRRAVPGCSVEVLIPDFKGDEDALITVIEAKPAILGHNLETVERLHPDVRPGGRYWRSISYLGAVKRIDPTMLTKTGLILGMASDGEGRQGVFVASHDLSAHLLQRLHHAAHGTATQRAVPGEHRQERLRRQNAGQEAHGRTAVAGVEDVGRFLESLARSPHRHGSGLQGGLELHPHGLETAHGGLDVIAAGEAGYQSLALGHAI